MAKETHTRNYKHGYIQIFEHLLLVNCYKLSKGSDDEL